MKWKVTNRRVAGYEKREENPATSNQSERFPLFI